VEKIPLILLSITSAVLTLRTQAYEGAVNPAAFPWGLRVENAIVSYGRYLGKFFWPAKLAIIYPYPRGGLRLAQVIGIAVILLAITAIAVRLRRSSPWLLFGWLYFLGTLVPVIGLVQVGSQAMADRYMYLPIMGLLIATVLGCAEFVEARKLSKPIIAVAAIAVVAMLSWRTWVEQSYWADDVHLFSRAIAITGANNAAENQLGLAIAKAGAVEQSLPHFQRALAINPRDEVAHADLGQYFLYHGDRTQAEREFREALADTRNRTLAATLYQNLGAIAWQQRRLDEAESRYQHAVALMPGEYRAWLNLGLIAFEEGKIDQAIRYDLQSLNAYPTSAGYVALARALRGANRIQEARAAYTEALKISPNFDLARRELEALPAVSH
jgi:Tfp pilus assembly protein PilF